MGEIAKMMVEADDRPAEVQEKTVKTVWEARFAMPLYDLLDRHTWDFIYNQLLGQVEYHDDEDEDEDDQYVAVECEKTQDGWVVVFRFEHPDMVADCEKTGDGQEVVSPLIPDHDGRDQAVIDAEERAGQPADLEVREEEDALSFRVLGSGEDALAEVLVDPRVGSPGCRCRRLLIHGNMAVMELIEGLIGLVGPEAWEKYQAGGHAEAREAAERHQAACGAKGGGR